MPRRHAESLAKGTTAVWDDDHLVFANIRSPGTLANLHQNASVEVNVATILESGPLFDRAIAFYKERASRVSAIREVVLIRVESVQPLDSPAYDFGLTEDEVRDRWERYYESLRGGEATTDRDGARGAGVAKAYINPASVFRSVDHGFSQAVAASGGRTLYTSGQAAWDAGKQLVGGMDLAAQARQAFRNLRSVVEASGGTLADIVSVRIYIVDYQSEKAAAVGQALRESFAGAEKPAATWIGVAALADPGFLIEVEATAVLA